MSQRHTLRHEGAAHNTKGERLYSGTAGTGRALCSCGATSPILTSGNQRRAWHRDHKTRATQPQTQAVNGV